MTESRSSIGACGSERITPTCTSVAERSAPHAPIEQALRALVPGTALPAPQGVFPRLEL